MSKDKRFYYNLMYWAGEVIIIITIKIKLITLNHIENNGRTVLVPLYFAEKGDFDDDGYMKIRYENIIPDTNFKKRQGYVVVSSDINKVAIYSRFLDKEMPVEIGEFLLKYQVRRPFGFFASDGIVRISFGSEDFYIKDTGLLSHFSRARYAILKVAPDGTSILYGLADMNYQDLGRFM